MTPKKKKTTTAAREFPIIQPTTAHHIANNLNNVSREIKSDDTDDLSEHKSSHNSSSTRNNANINTVSTVPPSYQLYQSATSKDDPFDAKVDVLPLSSSPGNLLPKHDPAMHMNISAKQVTFNNRISKYSPAQSTPITPSPQQPETPKQIGITTITPHQPQASGSHSGNNNKILINSKLRQGVRNTQVDSLNSGSTYLGDHTTSTIRTNSAQSNRSFKSIVSSASSMSSQSTIPSVNTPTSPDSLNTNSPNSPSNSAYLHSSLNQSNHVNRINMNNMQQPSPSPSPIQNNTEYRPWNRPRLNNRQSSTSFKKGGNNSNPFKAPDSNQSNELKMNHSNNVKNNNSFGSNHSENNGVKIRSSMIPPCPNLVNKKCRCKDILQQNHSAQKIWSGCYRIRIANKAQQFDNREIDIAYFDGLYGKLCKFFQYEVDTDRVPTKKDMASILKSHKGFIIDTKNTMVIDRCHFVDFWKWFRGCCDIIKDVYRLWDTDYPFQMNLFVDRKKCQEILQSTPDGMLAT